MIGYSVGLTSSEGFAVWGNSKPLRLLVLPSANSHTSFSSVSIPSPSTHKMQQYVDLNRTWPVKLVRLISHHAPVDGDSHSSPDCLDCDSH